MKDIKQQLEGQTKRNLAEIIRMKEQELKCKKDITDYRTSQLTLQETT